MKVLTEYLPEFDWSESYLYGGAEEDVDPDEDEMEISKISGEQPSGSTYTILKSILLES